MTTRAIQVRQAPWSVRDVWKTAPAALGLALALSGCAHSSSVAAGPGEPVAPAAHIATNNASGLVQSAAACWSGGVWAQAEGEEQKSDRRAQTEAHCHDVLLTTWGPPAEPPSEADRIRLEQLRAVEEGSVASIADKLPSLAGSESDKQDLRTLLFAVAKASREGMYARRAARKVSRDLASANAMAAAWPAKLTTDERAAVEPLSAHGEMDALTSLSAGAFSNDAHALGVMAAMDRFELAARLPRHLKVFAVRDAARLLFGVPSPSLGAAADPTASMQAGAWLEYLQNIAIAAGHPVPASAKVPQTRHDLAWAGVLGGIADKLEPDANRVSPALAPILRNTVAELRAQYQTVYHPR